MDAPPPRVASGAPVFPLRVSHHLVPSVLPAVGTLVNIFSGFVQLLYIRDYGSATTVGRATTILLGTGTSTVFMAPKLNLRILLRNTEGKNKIPFQDVRNNLVFGLADGLTSRTYRILTVKFQYLHQYTCLAKATHFGLCSRDYEKHIDYQPS